MTDFSRLDRADNWLARIGHAIRCQTMAVGIDRWRWSREYRVQRERSHRMLNPAQRRRGAEAARLTQAGVQPSAVRARLHGNAAVRTARAVDRYLGPASRAAR
jgi:hypothetical protein